MDLLGGLCGTLFASLIGSQAEAAPPVTYEPGGGIGFFWRPEMDKPRPAISADEEEEEILLALALLDI